MEVGRCEGKEIALEWAESRAGCDLLLGLDFLKTASEPPIRKTIEAIPSEQHAKTAERLRVASEFLSELRSKLLQKQH